MLCPFEKDVYFCTNMKATLLAIALTVLPYLAIAPPASCGCIELYKGHAVDK